MSDGAGAGALAHCLPWSHLSGPAHLFARELCGVSTGFSSANAAGGAVFGMGRGSQEARAEGSTRHAI